MGSTWGDPAPLKLMEIEIESTGSGPAYGGYPVIEGGFVNTDDWMGYLYINDAPFVFSYSLSGWIYMDEPAPDATGTWMYVMR